VFLVAKDYLRSFIALALEPESSAFLVHVIVFLATPPHTFCELLLAGLADASLRYYMSYINAAKSARIKPLGVQSLHLVDRVEDESIWF
jgi:hypothetical protein